MEVFKLASSCCANHLQNYMVFNDSCGIYTYAYEPEKKEDIKVSFDIYFNSVFTNEK